MIQANQTIFPRIKTMSIKCGFCKGTKVEPGQTDCVWCDSTGFEGGLRDKPVSDLDRVTAERDALQQRLTETDQRADDLQTENNLLRHDVSSCLETFATICTKLGIDVESAKDAPGRPSDVFVAHVEALEQRRRAEFEAGQAAEKQVDVLREEIKRRRVRCQACANKVAALRAQLAERDTLLRECVSEFSTAEASAFEVEMRRKIEATLEKPTPRLLLVPAGTGTTDLLR